MRYGRLPVPGLLRPGRGHLDRQPAARPVARRQRRQRHPDQLRLPLHRPTRRTGTANTEPGCSCPGSATPPPWKMSANCAGPPAPGKPNGRYARPSCCAGCRKPGAGHLHEPGTARHQIPAHLETHHLPAAAAARPSDQERRTRGPVEPPATRPGSRAAVIPRH